MDKITHCYHYIHLLQIKTTGLKLSHGFSSFSSYSFLLAFSTSVNGNSTTQLPSQVGIFIPFSLILYIQ